MEKTRTITPIENCSSDSVQFGFQTPSVIRDGGLGVDLKAMESVCQLGGIRRLIIEWTKETETPNVGKILPGGVATMGMSMATRRTKSDSELTNRSEEKIYREIAVNVELNRDRLLDDSRDITAEGLAGTLDREIRKEIAKRGLEFLLQPGGADAVIHTALLSLALTEFSLLVKFNIDLYNPSRWYESGLIHIALLYFFFVPFGKRILFDGRYSIIHPFGAEPIQALRFLFRLAHTQLIYSIPEEENQ